MVCSKCGKHETHSLGLCTLCYNKFYYAQKNYNTTLKDFVMNEQPKHYHTELKHFDDFKVKYDEMEKLGKVKKSALSKELGVSRETLYKYIRLYKGEV